MLPIVGGRYLWIDASAQMLRARGGGSVLFNVFPCRAHEKLVRQLMGVAVSDRV